MKTAAVVILVLLGQIGVAVIWFSVGIANGCA